MGFFFFARSSGTDIGIGTTAGDTLIFNGTAWIRLAIGTARQQLNTNAGATAPAWASSPHSLMTTTGDMLIASSANTPARLAIGTAQQTLRTNAGATAPEWANIEAVIRAAVSGTGSQVLRRNAGNTALEFATSAAGDGEWVKIARNTTGAFSSIASTNLMLMIEGVWDDASAEAARIAIRFNADTAGNYNWEELASGTNAEGVSQTSGRVAMQVGTGADRNFARILIFNQAAGEKKHWIANGGEDGGAVSGGGTIYQATGQWNNTADLINQIDLISTSGAIANGNFILYGKVNSPAG